MKSIRWMTVLVVFLIVAQAAQADWSTVRRITWTAGDSYSPALLSTRPVSPCGLV